MPRKSFCVEKERLIQRLIDAGYLSSPKVIQAMNEVPRELFIPKKEQRYAYADTPLEIGHGQTISAPHMVAIMAEALDIKEESKALEIGTGTGYHAAIIARIAKKGHVYTVERVKELIKKAKENMETLHTKNVTIVEGDGSLGLSKYAPYDRIYATCAAPSISPFLLGQLAKYGKMLIPVGRTFCRLMLVEKNDKTKEKDLGGCAFVPMIGKEGYDR